MLLRLRSTVVMMVVLALALAFFPATSHPVQAAPQSEMARIRFVNASVDASLLDAYINAALAVTSVHGASQYMDVPAGEQTFRFRLPGGSDDLATVTVTLAPEQRVTIAALNKQTALEAVAYVDDVAAPVWNGSKVKVVNAVVGGPAIDVTVGGSPVASGLAYGQASDTAQMYAGTYDVAVKAQGADILTQTGQVFGPDRLWTLFLIGDASAGTTPSLVPMETLTLNPTGSSLFRFAHMARGLDHVTVYINQEAVPIYQEVVFGGVTEYWAAAPGNYVYDIYAFGTSPADSQPIASGTATLAENQSVLFVIQGTKDALEAASYLSDLSPVPSGMARLQIINLAVGDPAFKVERMDGPAIFDSVAPLAEATKVVPGGNYAIRYSNVDNGQTMMEQGSVNVPPGSSTQMIAFDDDPELPLINAVTVSTDYVQQDPYIRWAHFNAWGPAVDIYMNDTLVAGDLAYKKVTDYQMYDPGVYTLSVYPAGADRTQTDPLWTNSMELAGENFARTMYVFGDADQSALGAAPDALDLLPNNTARVRFINAAVGAGVVDVVNATDNSVAVNDLQPGLSGSNVNVSAGSYSFNFVSDSGVIAKIEGYEMKAGTDYTVVMLGVYGHDDPGLEAIVLEFTP